MPDEFMFLILGFFALLVVGILLSARGEHPHIRWQNLARPFKAGERRPHQSGGG